MPDSENQLETHKNSRTIRITAILLVLFVGTFGLGFAAGKGQLKIASGKLQITKGTIPTGTADYSLLWQTLDDLNSKFVDRPLDQTKLMYGAVSGLVAAAGDPYTTFFSPDDAKKFQEQLRGSFEGIGAELGTKNDNIVIVAPLEDSPASKAGILAGDIILTINGESAAGMTTDDAVSKIRGPAGTSVKLGVVHPGKTTPVEITINRGRIEIKSVKLESKDDNGKKIAVIKINQFGDDTKGLLDKAIDSVTTGGYSGLVLDLRNNPGGYLETAVSTISDWIDEGQIAVKEIGNTNTDYKTVGVPRLKGMKTIILVNGGSASASEIVAGALQDYGVATLVGEKTFGKGSVQELDNLKDDAQLKVTIAKWYTPKGRGIHKIGLEPDVKVTLSPDDAAANKDPQMDKALELLK